MGRRIGITYPVPAERTAESAQEPKSGKERTKKPKGEAEGDQEDVG